MEAVLLKWVFCDWLAISLEKVPARIEEVLARKLGTRGKELVWLKDRRVCCRKEVLGVLGLSGKL